MLAIMRTNSTKKTFRFRLKTLFVVFLVFCIPLSWVGNRWRLYLKQHVVIRDIQRSGGDVRYGVPEGGGNLTEWLSFYPEQQAFVRHLLGTDLLDGVIGASWDASTSDKESVDRALVLLGRMENLRVLELSNFSDTSALPTLPNLQRLTLSGAKMGDIGSLNLPSLKEFWALDSLISDITALSESRKLEVFSMDRSSIASVLPLAQLTELREIHLEGTLVSDVSALARLKKLEILDLRDSKVSDLSPLAGLPNLRVLRIDSTPVADLSALSMLPKLEYLHATNTKVSDLRPLSGLSSLKHLELSETPVADLSGLSMLPKLEKLYLANTNISDARPLFGLPNLQLLSLAYTNVSDLTPLAHLTSLQTLYLADTPIADVAPLANLVQLRELDLRGTAASELDSLRHLKNVKILHESGEADSTQKVQTQELGD